MNNYKIENVNQYIETLQIIYDYFGGPIPLAKLLKTSVSSLYAWRSKRNFKEGCMIRKIPFHHAQKIAKAMPNISLVQIRPDLFN